MLRVLKSIGPAIIVTAVVLGPGSILTSSKVGASFGLSALAVVAGSAVLMIAMVALAARLGVVYEKSLCTELADRLGRPVSVLIGGVLFTLVALFQSSNNIALIGGLEPMLGADTLGEGARTGILMVVNFLIIFCLYLFRNLYSFIERVMKVLVGIMILAFLANLIVVFSSPRSFVPVISEDSHEWFPLLAMIGTTFSVAGAFYHAYLVKQKGWGLHDIQKGVADTVVSISILGLLTTVILLTAWRTFYGHPSAIVLSSVGDVARQLEPLFGSFAKGIFCIGILAGATSSFLVNAIIGGTVMSDAIGKGSNLGDATPRHLTTLALLVGMGVAISSLLKEGSVVHLITFAQALTVLGIPVLALALLYLGTRTELSGERKVPRWILAVASTGFLVSCVLAWITASKVYEKIAYTNGVLNVIAG